MLNEKSVGTRLATDIRSFLSGTTTETLLRQLKLVTEKLNPLPEVPPELM